MKQMALILSLPATLIACEPGAAYNHKIDELPLETKTVEHHGKKITIDVPKGLDAHKSGDGLPGFKSPDKEGGGEHDAELKIHVAFDSGGLPRLGLASADKYLKEKVENERHPGGLFHLTGLSLLNTTAHSVRNFRVEGTKSSTGQCRATISYSSSPKPPIEDDAKKRHAKWLHKICKSMKIAK